jgi:acyl CoA:acetate/3-ketoacid CoA transferase alpha subunit/acyl CoA:acetate/3-ketoacid CoA transferase beta subunit
MSIGEAVSKFLRPAMALHLAGGIGGPTGAICEILRQFASKRPRFTLVQSTVTGHALSLIHLNLVARMVFAACMEVSDTSRPSAIMQRAYKNGLIEIENWSLLSLQLRLMAAAWGLPFFPTKSLLSSSMIEANRDATYEMLDPFGSSQVVCLLRPLYPDISIIHGVAGDEEGNVILPVPYGEDLWGAFAAKEGVIATVERIISQSTIRRYAHLVKVPSHLVRAVCPVEFGLHPFYLFNPGVRGVPSYEADVEFLKGQYAASRDAKSYDHWLKEWVFDCSSHEGYLHKLGEERLRALREGLRRERVQGPKLMGWKELMLIVLSREIEESVEKNGHSLIVPGAGSYMYASFHAYHRLKTKGKEVHLVTGNGLFGFEPTTPPSVLPTFASVKTSRMLSDTVISQGVLVSGSASRVLSVIGAGQIDRCGNLNSTFDLQGNFLVGSGGANDVVNADEVIVAIEQSKDRFVERLPFVTARGDRVTKVVSSMGVFRKEDPKGELMLVACLPYPKGKSLRERIDLIRQNCSWPLKVAEKVCDVEEPTEVERSMFYEGLGQ